MFEGARTRTPLPGGSAFLKTSPAQIPVIYPRSLEFQDSRAPLIQVGTLCCLQVWGKISWHLILGLQGWYHEQSEKEGVKGPFRVAVGTSRLLVIPCCANGPLKNAWDGVPTLLLGDQVLSTAGVLTWLWYGGEF